LDDGVDKHMRIDTILKDIEEKKQSRGLVSSEDDT
jgi:hypothetical protein